MGNAKVYADTVFINGKVVTVDKDFSIKKAIAIKDGFIIDVGENPEIKEYIGPDTKVIDLEGKMIMPGANDAHCHSTILTKNMFEFDCSYPTDLPTFLGTIKDLVDKAEPGEWIKGMGYMPDVFAEFEEDPNFKITRQILDTVSPDNPVRIMDAGIHSALANTKALELAGITKDSPKPANGYFEKDENGELTGYLVEFGAMDVLDRVVPTYTLDEVKQMIMSFQDILVSEGITAYTDGMMGPGANYREGGIHGEMGIQAHQELLAEGKSKCRVSLMYYSSDHGCQTPEQLEYDLVNDYPKYKFDNPDMLKMPSVKFFADGDSSCGTGWFYDDYVGVPGHHGMSCWPGTEEEQAKALHDLIVVAHKHGMQVGVHAQGDKSAGEAIEGMIEAIEKYPRPNLRHYVIHADDYATNEQAMKASKFGCMFSCQPGYKKLYTEAFINVRGAQGERAGALKELMNAGVTIAGGADCVCGDYTSWKECAQQAITRRSANTGIVHHPELCISVEEAIRMFTIDGAYQEHQENVRGSIEIGKYADLQVLDQDIFMVDHEDIGKIKTLLTVLEGKVVYQDPSYTI